MHSSTTHSSISIFVWSAQVQGYRYQRWETDGDCKAERAFVFATSTIDDK